MRHRRVGRTVLCAAACLAIVAVTSAQPRFLPPTAIPIGRDVEVGDGDRIVVDGDARISLVRKHVGEVRVVADAAQRTIIVLADWGTAEHPSPDGAVNRSWRFTGISGAWPLEARWQGLATILEPELLPHPSAIPISARLTLETPAGRVVFQGGPSGLAPPSADAIVIHHQSMSAGGPDGASFEAAERFAQSSTSVWQMGSTSLGAGGPAAMVGFGSMAGASGARFAAGTPRMPVAIRQVLPVWPDPATLPGVQGVVTVRVTIGADGAVRDAVVVQGLPALNDAALAAARQWQFAPDGTDARPFSISWPYPLRAR